MRLVTLALVLALAVASMAFAPALPKPQRTSQAITVSPSARSMAPKFIGSKWVAQSDAEKPGAGYDVFGTLLRQGPEPAITRIFNPDDYEQAVLKFMASEKCDRNTAQGNMDAYLRNPPDWTYVRMEDEKRGFTRDYVTLKPKEVAKVLVWSSMVMGVVGRSIFCLVTGASFNL